MTNENKHTEIWDRLFETPPAHTKDFKKGGGFGGTAIAPTYIIKRMTEEFGPHGLGWGWEIQDEEYIDGAPLTVAGELTEVKEVIHKIRLRLWYKIGDDIFYIGPHFGQTTFVGSNKNGFFTDEEHAKKSITDAVSKCVVQLGLSADIHIGLYDDNKYIKALHEKYSGGDGSTGDKKTTTNSRTDRGKEGEYKKVSPAQIKRLKAIKTDFGWTDEAAKDVIRRFGYESSKDIEHWEDYSVIVKELQKGMDGKAKADADGYCIFLNGKPKEMKK